MLKLVLVPCYCSVMSEKVYLLIFDTDHRRAGKKYRKIRIFTDYALAVTAKDRYVQKLYQKYPHSDFTVMNTLAREYVACFRVPAPHTCAMKNTCRWLKQCTNPQYLLQVIIRIEPGILVDEAVDEPIDEPLEPEPEP